MRTPALLLLLTLTGCGSAASPRAIPPVEQTDDLIRARLGQRVSVNGPKVTPLEVLEDSRCPVDTHCVWVGRVRLSIRVDLGGGSRMHELTQGQPLPIADGTLELVEVQPDPSNATKPGDYRFGFRFMGGL